MILALLGPKNRFIPLVALSSTPLRICLLLVVSGLQLSDPSQISLSVGQ